MGGSTCLIAPATPEGCCATGGGGGGATVEVSKSPDLKDAVSSCCLVLEAFSLAKSIALPRPTFGAGGAGRSGGATPWLPVEVAVTSPLPSATLAVVALAAALRARFSKAARPLGTAGGLVVPPSPVGGCPLPGPGGGAAIFGNFLVRYPQ